MGAQGCLNCFTNINSSNPSNSPTWLVLLVLPSYGGGNWDTERLNNLLKVTQLVSSTAGIKTRQASSKVQALSRCIRQLSWGEVDRGLAKDQEIWA